MGISNTMFYIYSWENYLKKYWDNKPSYSILYIISLMTCLYLWGQIFHSFTSHSKGLIKEVILKDKGNLFKFFNFLIGILIIGIFAIQLIGLTHKGNIKSLVLDIPDYTKGFIILSGICYICSCIAISFLQTKKIYGVLIISIISMIIYYSSMITIIHNIEKNTSSNNSENPYINHINIPVTLILIIYLFLYCIILRSVSSLRSTEKQCYNKYISFTNCLEKSNLSNNLLKKLLADLKNRKDDIEKLKTVESKSCHKDAISALVINMLIILTGSNVMFAFLKPDMFIAGLVIQRLFFGSYYNPSRKLPAGQPPAGQPPAGSNYSKNYTIGQPQLVKTWDLLGFPLIKFILWFSDVSPDIYDHDVEFGSTNNELFGLGKKIGTSLPLGRKKSDGSSSGNIFSQIWGKSHSSTDNAKTPELKKPDRDN